MPYCYVFVFLISSGMLTGSYAQDILPEFNLQAEQILQESIVEGMIDYERLNEEIPGINRFKHQFVQFNTRNMSPDSLTAFYINVYNMMMLSEYSNHYPQPLTKQFSRRAELARLEILGENMTLKELRLNIEGHIGKSESALVLIQPFKEGPVTLDIVYNGKDLDRQVKEGCQQVLDDPFLIRVDPEKRQVSMSVFFRDLLWDDFAGREDSLLRFINQYRSESIPYGFDIVFFPGKNGWNALPFERVRK